MSSLSITTKRKPGVLLCLTGYATAGKDALADILVRKYGYEKFSWADPLYEIALACNPWIKCKNGVFIRMQELVGSIGWTEAKEEPEVRAFLQNLGTEGIRNNLGEDSFVNAMSPVIKEKLREGVNCVVTNTRFQNEVAAGIRMDGMLAVVENYRVDAPVNSHVSDAGLAFKDANMVIQNHGTLDDLEHEADVVHDSMQAARDETVDPRALLSLEQIEARWDQTIRRAINLGVEMVVACAAPYDCDSFKKWKKRHELEVEFLDKDTISIFIDSEEAGTVEYNNGILTVDVNLAR